MKVIYLEYLLIVIIGLKQTECSSIILVEDARGKLNWTISKLQSIIFYLFIVVCFQRVLAGQRISPRCVLRRLFCERLEDCRRECASEKRFVCEGFNYR